VVTAILELVLNILDRFLFNSLTAVIVVCEKEVASATSKGVDWKIVKCTTRRERTGIIKGGSLDPYPSV
jgi:hypothetical protein